MHFDKLFKQLGFALDFRKKSHKKDFKINQRKSPKTYPPNSVYFLPETAVYHDLNQIPRLKLSKPLLPKSKIEKLYAKIEKFNNELEVKEQKSEDSFWSNYWKTKGADEPTDEKNNSSQSKKSFLAIKKIQKMPKGIPGTIEIIPAKSIAQPKRFD